MARYIREVELNRPEDFVQYIMTDFLSKQGFCLKEFKGEMVYRAGDGFLEIPKFLTWGYRNGIFHIEAWTRNCWLPGVYGRENALTGFMGCIPKDAYKKDIEALIGLLFQPLEQPMNANGQTAANGWQGMQGAYGMPQNPGMNVQQPVYVRGTDMSRYATMALVFSLIGIACICLSGILGLIWGSLGIVYGKKAMDSQKKGMATAAFVIGIIVDVLAAVVCILKIAAMVVQMG